MSCYRDRLQIYCTRPLCDTGTYLKRISILFKILCCTSYMCRNISPQLVQRKPCRDIELSKPHHLPHISQTPESFFRINRLTKKGISLFLENFLRKVKILGCSEKYISFITESKFIVFLLFNLIQISLELF